MLPAAERPRLTLEDYIVFFTTRSGGGLNLHHLNHIIYMHGFARLHRAPKVHTSPSPTPSPSPSTNWVADHWRPAAGDGGRAPVGGAHAPAPLHRPLQRHRAAAGRRPGRARRALA
jgi:hypothetical protein